jgi:2-phospho-L-lactate guanylyltransferase
MMNVWSVVVPVKRLAEANSRLGPATGDAARPEFALAFALDTVSAALACPVVRDVIVVTDDRAAGARLTALGARTVADGQGGLNAALTHGARRVRTPVAAMNADLPALRPAELAAVLTDAGRSVRGTTAGTGSGRAFLADADGIGTTLLAAASGAVLRPAFGGASRARHLASGAREITLAGVDTVRRDVDTADDLRTAIRMGVGRHTAAALALHRAPDLVLSGARPGLGTLAAMQATAYTYDAENRSGSVLLDDGTPVPFDAAAFDAGGLRLLRPGQRVRIEVEGEGDGRRVTFVTLQTL